MLASCRRVLKFHPPIARFSGPDRGGIEACARGRAAAVVLLFGSDFTEVEQRLIPALQVLQEAQRTPLKLPGLLWQGMTQPPDAADLECLARLGLDRPTTLAERAYRALVSAALVRSRTCRVGIA